MKKQEDLIPEGYNRVTEILTPYKNFTGVAPSVLANATSRGSITHDFCELYALDMLIEIPPPHVNPFVESFKQWFDEYVDQVIMTETRINHPKYRISGQFDLLLKFKGSDALVLADYKTPETADKTWVLQTAAYMILLEDILGIKVDRRICVMLDREGKYPKVIEYTNHERDKRLYINQIEMFRFFN